MIVVPYIPEHLAAMSVQPAQAMFADQVPENYAQWLHDVGPSFTVLADVGVIAICGVAEEWEGRAQAWGMLAASVRPYLVSVTRACRSYFDGTSYRRIEAQTPKDFIQGQRWLGMLGFTHEGEMKNYYPDGRTAIRYARVKP